MDNQQPELSSREVKGGARTETIRERATAAWNLLRVVELGSTVLLGKSHGTWKIGPMGHTVSSQSAESARRRQTVLGRPL